MFAFDLYIMNFNLKILSCPLLSSATIHDNCFVFSGHINLKWNLCIVGLFWVFDLWPWYYDLHLDKFIFWAMACTLNGNCFIFAEHSNLTYTLKGHFHLSPCNYDLWLWPSQCWDNNFNLVVFIISICLVAIQRKSYVHVCLVRCYQECSWWSHWVMFAHWWSVTSGQIHSTQIGCPIVVSVKIIAPSLTALQWFLSRSLHPAWMTVLQ